MSSLLRIALLGCFAVTGVGLAIYVGTLAPPDRAHEETLPGPEVVLPSVVAEQATMVEPDLVTPTPVAQAVPLVTLTTAQLPAEPSEESAPVEPPGDATEPKDEVDHFLEKFAQLQGYLDKLHARREPPQANTPATLAGPALQASGVAQPAVPEELPSESALEEPEPVPADPKTMIRKSIEEGDDRLSITIQGEEIRKVLELLSEQGGLNILASNNVTGTVSATLQEVDIETALNAILKSTGYRWRREGDFLYVGTPADFDAMAKADDSIGTRLYRLNYVLASEIQGLIAPLLTEGVGSISITSPAEQGIANNSFEVGGDDYAGQDTVLVRDYEAVLAQVDQIVDQIDRRPTQVQIEAMILSVRLNDRNELGVNFEALRNEGAIRLTSGSPLTNLANFDLSERGLKVGFLDSSLSLFVEALESIGDTNVVATPRLMCLNKHRAEVLIGSQLGYVSTTQTETSTTQSVEFLEVGTQLRLRPFIASDGVIRMEVHPELSSGNVRIEQGLTLPDKEVTEVTTNIMVRDGHTVVIGGLMREELISTATQIPFFGSLPVVGAAFRQNTESTERREILVLITPHIVVEPEACAEGQCAAQEFHHRHNVYADQMIPTSKRYLGRKYFRQAQRAWSNGDARAALRNINLAIGFDPLNRAAINLRADIVAGRPLGEHTLDGNTETRQFEAEALNLDEAPSDERALPRSFWKRIEAESTDYQPRDLGRPGDRIRIVKPNLRVGRSS